MQVLSAVSGDKPYIWFAYSGKPIKLKNREDIVKLVPGSRFGIRRSSTHQIVFTPEFTNKVFTLSKDGALFLSNHSNLIKQNG